MAPGDFYTDGPAGAVVAPGEPTSSGRQPLLLTKTTDTLGTHLPVSS